MEVPTADAEVKSATWDDGSVAAEIAALQADDAISRVPRAPSAGLAPPLERMRMQLYMVQLFIDVVLLLGGFALAGAITGDRPNSSDSMLLAYLQLPMFLTIAFYSATYSRRTLTDWRLASTRAAGALLVASALLAFVAFFAKLEVQFSRLEFALGMGLTFVMMVLARYLLATWVQTNWGPATINRLVIDAGGPQVTMRNVYRINAREHALIPSVDDPAALDRLAQYLRNMDEVLVSCPQADRYAWTEVLKGSGVHGEVISSFAREIGALGIIHHEESNISALLVSTGPLAMRSRVMKRAFDIAVSGVALLMLSPLLLTCAILIKLEDGGSVFFKQRRMGRGNRFFSIYKFRSMRETQSDADGKRSASKDDDRITKIGRILRKTSIDELPQLINVLRGEMSLVGPRPHALGSQAGSKLFWQVDRRYWQRHCLRPGITGLAQVRGFRGATDTEQDLTSRLQADLEYIQGWTIWRDMHVLLSTLKVLVHHRAF
jgi:exopolysaccharide biosynthesis polyprenyl glycosylphosphotransferase